MFIAAFALALSACGGAAAPAGQLAAEGVWVRKSASGQNSAIYLTLKNGPTEDTLVQASTDVAMATEIHETVAAASGMMEMRPLTAGLKVPANGAVALAPGSYHILLMNLKQDLTMGSNVKLKLTFKSGKVLELTAPVQEGPATKKP